MKSKFSSIYRKPVRKLNNGGGLNPNPRIRQAIKRISASGFPFGNQEINTINPVGIKSLPTPNISKVGEAQTMETQNPGIPLRDKIELGAGAIAKGAQKVGKGLTKDIGKTAAIANFAKGIIGRYTIKPPDRFKPRTFQSIIRPGQGMNENAKVQAQNQLERQQNSAFSNNNSADIFGNIAKNQLALAGTQQAKNQLNTQDAQMYETNLGRIYSQLNADKRLNFQNSERVREEQAKEDMMNYKQQQSGAQRAIQGSIQYGVNAQADQRNQERNMFSQMMKMNNSIGPHVYRATMNHPEVQRLNSERVYSSGVDNKGRNYYKVGNSVFYDPAEAKKAKKALDDQYHQTIERVSQEEKLKSQQEFVGDISTTTDIAKKTNTQLEKGGTIESKIPRLRKIFI